MCSKALFSLHSTGANSSISRYLLLLAAVSLLLFAGCSSKGSGGQDGLDGADGTLSEADLAAQREARFGEGSIPSAEGEGFFRDVRFGYDSAELDSIARQNVDYNAELLRENPGISLTLEGHADERGTAEYNLALGAERARAVKEVLASLGIPSSRIDTVSYGEEVPLDPGKSEEAYAKNRRVHFSASSSSVGRSTR